MDEALADQVFPIQGYGDDFFTGVCADGRQVVMGLLCPQLVAYFFDQQGNLVGSEHRLWNKPAPQMGRDGPYQIHDGAFQDALADQLRQWQKELGFRASTINVRPFLDERYPVGVSLFPSHLEPNDSEELDEDGRKELEGLRSKWLADGLLVS